MKNANTLITKYYLKHLKPVKGLFILHLLGITLGVILSMAYPILYKWMIDIMTEATDITAVVPDLIKLLITIVILDTINTGFWRVAGYTYCKLQPKVMANIGKECFDIMHHHSARFFNNSFTGSLVKKVNRIVRAFESITDLITFEFYPVLFRLVIAISVMTYLDWRLGLILFIWAVIFIIGNYWFSLYKQEKYDLPKVKADSKVTGQLADTISNHSNIKLFSNLSFENKHFSKTIQDWEKKTSKSWFMGNHAELVQAITMIAVNVGLLYIAVVLWADGQISIGDFALIQFYLLEMFRQLWMFGRNVRRLYEAYADAEEMMEIIELDIEVKDSEEAKELSLTRGEIEFKKVKFAYEDGKTVLKKLDLKIKPGEKIALIGPSGGGKSTITKLLLRLFDLTGGHIEIDHQDIANITQDSLRRNIALVPQDPILFHRTLMENIRYGNLEASDEAVIAAAKYANCHEFIQQLPKKYDTYVGERGVKLSGGERQRIAIARAMLSNARILILDEATSNLDSESETLIQDALKKLTKNKTTLIIAHRLSTIVHTDRILVLNKGEIVEEGTHYELIKKNKSLYKNLWELQTEGYLT